jgi:hypothetical protein
MYEAFEALLGRYASAGSVLCRQGRRTYPAHVSANPPASLEKLQHLEAWLGGPLPTDYRAFLAR